MQLVLWFTPYRYSFAIVGINITDLAYNLLVSGALKTHFYNIAPEAPTLSHFQQTFCKCPVAYLSMQVSVEHSREGLKLRYLFDLVALGPLNFLFWF